MTLAEIIQEVYEITGRPDLVAKTASAVKSATLRAHHRDYWYKDMVQASLVLQADDYVQVFDTSLLNRYRAMKFLRIWIPDGVNLQTGQSTGRPGSRIDCVDPDSVLDDYQRDRAGVYYVAGTQVNVRLAAAGKNLLVGWYRHPDVTAAGYDSWIANEHPFAIINAAASQIFKGIGYDEQQAFYRDLVAEEFALITLSNIEAEAR